MKKLFKNISLKKLALGLTLFFISYQGWAQSPIARVTKIRGDVFVTSNGRMDRLRVGQHLYDQSQITTAVGAEVSFNDFFDHIYHLAGQGQVHLSPQVIELHRGYFWVQSLGPHERGFEIRTANARLRYSKGQGVISFNPEDGRTQFLSVDGRFPFGNLVLKELDVTVGPGEFSFVDQNYHEGVPRHSTTIGKQTFETIVSLFPGLKVQPTMAPTQFMVDRRPASVEASPAPVEGKVLFIPLERDTELKSKREGLLKSYSQTTSKPKKTVKRAPASVETTAPKSGNVPVIIFGRNEKAPSAPKREPASVKVETPVEAMIEKARRPASVETKDPFEQGLKEQYRQQMRHSDEVNSLIRDLKNYRMDLRSSF